MAVRLTPSIQPFITIVRNSLGLFPALLSATCDPVRKSFPQEDTMWPPFLQENSVSSLHPRKSSYKVCWLDLDSSSPDWSPCRTGALGGVNGRQILLQFLSQPAVPPIEKTPNTEKCPSTVRREEESDIMRVAVPGLQQSQIFRGHWKWVCTKVKRDIWKSSYDHFELYSTDSHAYEQTWVLK